MTDPNAAKRLASDGSSVSGKGGDRLRPTSANVGAPHSVEPGVNDGLEDWEKYYRTKAKDNSVDDTEEIMKKIGVANPE